MDRKELKTICKKENIFMYQIAEHLGVSEPTFIRWMRHPVTGELESQILTAVKEIVSMQGMKEGSDHA